MPEADAYEWLMVGLGHGCSGSEMQKPPGTAARGFADGMGRAYFLVNFALCQASSKSADPASVSVLEAFELSPSHKRARLDTGCRVNSLPHARGSCCVTHAEQSLSPDFVHASVSIHAAAYVKAEGSPEPQTLLSLYPHDCGLLAQPPTPVATRNVGCNPHA